MSQVTSRGEAESYRRSIQGILVPLIRWLAVLAVGFLVITVLSVYILGHKNVTLAFILYLPSWLWALPCLLVLPFCLILDRKRSGLIVLISLFLFFGTFQGYEWRQPRPLNEKSGDIRTLKILTYNRGQSQGTSLRPFKNSVQPDLLALQESGGRGEKYQHAEGYKEFTHAASEGEFTLLSAYPIVSSSLINCSSTETPTKPTVVAARFEVQWNGKLILYNVHMPTHRGMLYSDRTGGFLSGILGIPGTPWAKKRVLREVYWNSQLELAYQLAARIRSESAPVIVVGDFNAPPFGPFYRTFDSFLEDGHKRAGSGFGYSFPGETHNPMAFGGPWLRLDYIFCSPSHLRTIRHITETDRSSQHLAVFAELEANHGS